jgi:hypothetical protein
MWLPIMSQFEPNWEAHLHCSGDGRGPADFCIELIIAPLLVVIVGALVQVVIARRRHTVFTLSFPGRGVIRQVDKQLPKLSKEEVGHVRLACCRSDQLPFPAKLRRSLFMFSNSTARAPRYGLLRMYQQRGRPRVLNQKDVQWMLHHRRLRWLMSDHNESRLGDKPNWHLKLLH